MKHSKKHNTSGAIFIEVMFALTLLAIFGTSLFMVQSILFTKTFTTHAKVITLEQINMLNIEFETEKTKQKQSKEPMQDIISKQELKTPLEHLSIESKDIPEESSLHKHFANYVKLIHQSGYFDTKQETFTSFEFLPPEEEKEIS